LQALFSLLPGTDFLMETKSFTRVVLALLLRSAVPISQMVTCFMSETKLMTPSRLLLLLVELHSFLQVELPLNTSHRLVNLSLHSAHLAHQLQQLPRLLSLRMSSLSLHMVYLMETKSNTRVPVEMNLLMRPAE
jgi:hypothetical protein